MKNTIISFVIFLLLATTTFGQTKKDLNIDYMLRGHIYAQSSIVDSTALGGFGGSNNFPKKMNDSLNFSENGLFLKIDTMTTTTIDDEFNGYTLYIGNKSDTIAQLEASDSRLYVIAEVYYKDKWKAIEYIPSSWCGNSYHNVYLKQNEYWSFDIPKFTGKIETRLRYRLMISREKFIYSNEILVSFNKKQLEEKQDHTPNGLMDPYDD